MSDALARIANLVRRESGMRLDPSRNDSLLAALARISPDVDATAFLRLVEEPIAGPEAVVRLLDELLVKETSFLRDRGQLDAIDWHALRENAQAAGSELVRVWSAACATGEEPYSLALLAYEAFGSPNPPVQILATDISASALAAAKRGRYRERSLKAVDEELRRRYFVPESEGFAVSSELRRLVRFAAHNLVRDRTLPVGSGPFDLILCRNVLIYFDAATVDHVTAALERRLALGGRLVLGAADALNGATRRLEQLTSGAPAQRRPRTSAQAGPLRRPLGRRHEPSATDRLADALRSADEGRVEESLAIAATLVADDVLNPDLYFLRGLIELESGAATAAVWSLRRALYLDPDFGMAAFKLGRAHESCGEHRSAEHAYGRALVALAEENERDERHLGKIDVADALAACRARMAALDSAAAKGTSR